jgi:hypothetical protein
MILYDLDHLWGNDLAVTPTGDIALVSVFERTVNRVIRRLMTAATTALMSDYPFEPGYGIGLGERVGDASPDLLALQGVVRSQLLLEPSVARVPQPIINVYSASPDNSTVVIAITVTDLSGTPNTFSFNLGPSAP